MYKIEVDEYCSCQSFGPSWTKPETRWPTHILLTLLANWPTPRRCTQAAVEIEAPQLQAGAKPLPPGEHAEVEAIWRFNCAAPGAVGALDVGGLLDAYPRIQQLSAQVAGPGGQHQARLKRPTRSLVWAK